MLRTVRVLVVDASIVGRHLVGRALAAEPWIEVVAVTTPGPVALKRLEQLSPDVVMLDVGDPIEEGLALMRAIHSLRPRLPVIMLTTAERSSGAAVLLEILAVGGADLCTVPAASGDLDGAADTLRAELVPRLRSIVESDLGRRRSARPATAHQPWDGDVASTSAPVCPPLASYRPPARSARGARVEIVVVGASTGGPNALKVLWSLLPRELPVPVLLVQHMPATFTPMLAGQLDRVGTLPCREAASGDRPVAGTGLLAPGDHHLVVAGGADGAELRLDDSPRLHGCRPAVDRLFGTAAEVYGAGVLAVVLTGMGVDGLAGCRAVGAAGGEVIVQDAMTSVVWGMPGSVADAGLADAVLPLVQIGPMIIDRVALGRPSFAGALDAWRERVAGPAPSAVIT